MSHIFASINLKTLTLIIHYFLHYAPLDRRASTESPSSQQRHLRAALASSVEIDSCENRTHQRMWDSLRPFLYTLKMDSFNLTIFLKWLHFKFILGLHNVAKKTLQNYHIVVILKAFAILK